ncbi:MAG: hypothetical protein EOM05_01535 [Clostridia bacterium]|nr:hypothetical protein [Clostridia bacterium]
MNFLNKFKQVGKTKKYALIISVLLIVAIAAGGTLAWISTSDAITSGFSVADVKCSVLEDLSGNNKENVRVENTGSIDEYIRATIVMSWIDEDGNTVAQEVKASDYTMSLNETDWFVGTDGYYYCKAKVAQGDKTQNLINSCVMNNTTSGYTFKLDVIAAAIQANPKDAVEDAWSAVEVDANGILMNSEEAA